MKKGKAAGESSNVGALAACLAYSVCSITMVLSNKALAASFPINIPIMLVVFQCIAAVFLVESCRALGIVSYRGFEVDIAMKWLPVNVCYVAMLLTSFMAFKHLNVPMITVFKNLTNVIIVVGDWYWHQQLVTAGVVFSFGVMVVGAVAAAASDVMFTPVGYFWMSMNCLSTASYVLYMKSATKNIEISKFGMVFYNNLLSIPLLVPFAFSFGEVGTILSTMEVVTDIKFIITNLIAGSMGFFLNLASLWCVSSTSATTYALVGSVNKIPVSLLGAFLFQTVITSQGATYIMISMCGGFIYSYVKLQEARKR